MPANEHRSVDLLRRAACESNAEARRCAPTTRRPASATLQPNDTVCDQVSTTARHQGHPRTAREFDGSCASMAVAEAAKALRHYDGQRPRRADLPQLGGRHGPRWTQSAVGGGHHLRRHCDRLRLSRRDPRCLVTPGCRLRDQPLHRCPSHHRRPAGHIRRSPLTPDTQIYDIDGYLNGCTTTDDNRRTIASRKSTRMLPRCDHQVYAKSALKFSPRVCEWPICGDAADPFVRCERAPLRVS